MSDKNTEPCLLEIQMQIIQYLRYCLTNYTDQEQMQVAIQKLNEYLKTLPKKALNKSNS